MEDSGARWNDQTRYDVNARRRGKRNGNEKGCWIYVPAEEPRRMGIDPADPAPEYRIYSGRRQGMAVTLYKPDRRASAA